MGKIANKTIQYSVYHKRQGQMGYVNNTTDLTLPVIEYGSDEISGAGIMGKVEMPSFTDIQSMIFAMGIRADSEQFAAMSAPGLQEFEVRYVIEKFNTSDVAIGIEGHKAVIKGFPKKYDPGKVEVGSTGDGSVEIETTYYKKTIDGKVIIEVDKFNGKLIINGVDYSGQYAGLL
jgi:P2 family phage contractile tail tube protein